MKETLYAVAEDDPDKALALVKRKCARCQDRGARFGHGIIVEDAPGGVAEL